MILLQTRQVGISRRVSGISRFKRVFRCYWAQKDEDNSASSFLWHADSFHFVYPQVDIYRPFLGSVCGDPVPLLDTSDTPAFQIEWVDTTRFLFVKGWTDSGSAELRPGQIGGQSILIGPFNGTPPHFPGFSFNLETAPLRPE